MTLGRLFGVAATALGLLGLIAAVALVSATTRMRSHSDRIVRSLASVRAAEELHVQLLTHDRERRLLEVTGEALHADNMTIAREELEAALALAEANVFGQDERRLVSQARHSVAEYLEAVESGAPAAERRGRLDVAVRTAQRLVDYNVVQAEADEAAARALDAFGNVAGFGLSALLLAAMLGTMWMIRRRVFSPLAELRAGVAQLRGGARQVRVPPNGVAELQAVADEFNEMADQLHRHEEAQVRFLAGVAHDLRNPLHALKLSISALTRREELPPPEKIRKTLRVVSEQADRLDRMLGDLLDRTRIEAGNVPLQREPTDLVALTSSIVELHRDSSALHRVTLQAGPDELQVSCDPVRIAQVLNNLVSNAIKYSPRGGEVRVAVRSERGSAILEVADEGLGIPEEERSKIFEPFRRSRSHAADIPGVGLGLSVSRRIVEAHGGSIAVESNGERGSRFIVRLPAPSEDARVELH